MKYIFSTDSAFAAMCYLTDKKEETIERAVFNDLIFNFTVNCINSLSQGGCTYADILKTENGLLLYLTDEQIDCYVNYLYDCYWSHVERTLKNQSNDDCILVSTYYDNAIIIEIKKPKSPLERYIDELCIRVSHDISGGQHVDPAIMTLYQLRMGEMN